MFAFIASAMRSASSPPIANIPRGRNLARALWESKIFLGSRFFQEVITNPVPIDMHVLRAVKRSPLGLDLYLWLTYRTFKPPAPAAAQVAAALPAVRRSRAKRSRRSCSRP